MGMRAERLFMRLQTIEALRELIGTSENSDLECKQWSASPEDNRGALAKAACGLANAEGGVIIIGMDARGEANEPDVIRSFVFVPNLERVAAIVRDIISDGLEPGIRDIQMVQIAEREGGASGCLVVYIAEEDGTPQRVKKTRQFYVRMATATLPMLYSQIADRFGRRPHAKLLVEPTELSYVPGNLSMQGSRLLDLFVTNVGRGSARFPALRCLKKSDLFDYVGPYGTKPPRWTHFDDQTEWFSYRGGANDVLHPGEKIAVASLFQRGMAFGEPVKDKWGHQEPSRRLHFTAITLQTSVICEGIPELIQSFWWPELHHDPK